MLSEIAKIGADPEGGVSRLGFTPAERDAHDLVGGWLRDLGLEVRVDAIGNTIAERPGTADGTPASRVYVGIDGFMLPMVTDAEVGKRHEKRVRRRKPTPRRRKGVRRRRLVRGRGADRLLHQHGLRRSEEGGRRR